MLILLSEPLFYLLTLGSTFTLADNSYKINHHRIICLFIQYVYLFIDHKTQVVIIYKNKIF